MKTELRANVDLLVRSAEAMLLSASDEGRILEAAMSLLGQQYGYGSRYVLLHDAESRELRLATVATSLREDEYRPDYRCADDVGLAGLCFQMRTVVNCPDVTSDDRYVRILPWCRSEILVPVVAGERALGVLGVESDRVESFSAVDEQALAAFARVLALALVQARDRQEMRRLALVDELTGAYNLRHSMQRLREEMETARRHDDDVSLLVIDGDHMKLVNDRFGHAEGNRLLAKVTDAMRGALRLSDVLGRFGGDEFIVVLPRTSPDDAITVAERLRQAIAACDLRSPRGESIRLTASIGVATYPCDAKTADDLFGIADRALYAAKQNGRNRVALGARL
jgi:diguanylate cyclase (GGDEF)-like protein